MQTANVRQLVAVVLDHRMNNCAGRVPGLAVVLATMRTIKQNRKNHTIYAAGAAY